MTTASRLTLAYARARAVVERYTLRRYRYETLRQIGWPLFRVARFVNWCGHGQELIPLPDEGEWVRMVPVLGTVK